MRLRPAEGDAEAGHHLVENEHAAIVIAEFAQAFEKTRLRRDAIHIARHRLDDDAGDLAADLREGVAHLIELVVIQRQRMFRQRRRHPGRRGHAQRQRAGAGLHQQ